MYPIFLEFGCFNCYLIAFVSWWFLIWVKLRYYRIYWKLRVYYDIILSVKTISSDASSDSLISFTDFLRKSCASTSTTYQTYMGVWNSPVKFHRPSLLLWATFHHQDLIDPLTSLSDWLQLSTAPRTFILPFKLNLLLYVVTFYMDINYYYLHRYKLNHYITNSL